MSQDKPGPLSFLFSLIWMGVVFGLPVAALTHPQQVPLWMVWLSWAWLIIALAIASLGSVMMLWACCALPYGDFNPTPGGPGQRMIAYHPQLQRRVDGAAGWDLFFWKVGICLRLGVFLPALIFLMSQAIPNGNTLLPVIAAFLVALIGAAALAALLPSLAMWLVRELWARLEPPTLAPAVSEEGVGVAPVEVSRLQSSSRRYTPLAVLVLGLVGGPPWATGDLALGFWGVAACALLGYPIYCWSDYWARQR